MKKAALVTEIQVFLTRYCQQEKRLSRETVLSYRDALKLFIIFYRDQMKRQPDALGIEALSYESVVRFLDYLETERGSSISTRNQRLCALRSLARYVLFRHPDCADTLSRCLAVPMKKRAKKNRSFLEPNEVSALLKAIDTTSWIGRRDRVMLDLCIRTGLRVSELTGLRSDSFKLQRSPYLTVEGKGRKERSVPLEKAFAKIVANWITNDLPNGWVYAFPTQSGNRMSTDSVQHALKKYVSQAAKSAPSLRKKCVSPHTLRHTTAMQMLSRGVDIEIIALWLGHEQLETTQLYFSESLAIKRKALKKTRFTTELKPPIRPLSSLSFLDDL